MMLPLPRHTLVHARTPVAQMKETTQPPLHAGAAASAIFCHAPT
jgi:hypothetical protein